LRVLGQGPERKLLRDKDRAQLRMKERGPERWLLRDKERALLRMKGRGPERRLLRGKGRVLLRVLGQGLYRGLGLPELSGGRGRGGNSECKMQKSKWWNHRKGNDLGINEGRRTMSEATSDVTQRVGLQSAGESAMTYNV